MANYEARSTIYLTDPRQISVDWRDNFSRNGEQPPVDDDLIALARDMMPKSGDGASEDGSSGQLNPITCLPSSGDKMPKVIGGFRRLRAALWLIESGTCPDFKVKYTTTRMSPVEAALANVCENMHREDPKPIQLAHAVRKFTEDYGMPLAVIAGRLKKSPQYLGRLLELVSLPASIQKSISDGETTVTAGLELTKVADPADVFAEARSSSVNGKVKATGVKKAARKKAEANGKANGPVAAATVGGKTPKPRVIPRSLAEVREFFEAKAGPTETLSSRKMAGAIVDYMAGKITDDQMADVWQEYF